MLDKPVYSLKLGKDIVCQFSAHPWREDLLGQDTNKLVSSSQYFCQEKVSFLNKMSLVTYIIYWVPGYPTRFVARSLKHHGMAVSRNVS